MLISIIIPIYNTENYLRQCLDSIVAQTVSSWEAVLVDDGSTDGSAAICDEYARRDDRFRVYHRQNGGVGRARNYGLDMALGEVVSFVDADDWLDVHFYERLMPLMGDNDLVYVSDMHHYADGTMVTHEAHAVHACDRDEVERTLLYLKDNRARYPFFGFTWNKLFRADIIREHNLRFVEDLTLCEDEAFTDDYCKYVERMAVVSEPLYHYRAGMSGLTGRKKDEREFFRLIVHITMVIPNYHFPQLVAYEERRVYGLVTQCIQLRGGYMQDYKKQLELLRLCDRLPAVEIGQRAKVVLLLGPPGRWLMRLYRFVFRQSFL